MMQPSRKLANISLLALLIASIGLAVEAQAAKEITAPSVAQTAVGARSASVLSNGWKFMFEPSATADDIAKPSFSDKGWETVSIPHTWNAKDGQSIKQTGLNRGVGFYRLTFNKPANVKGQKYWIEFGAVSQIEVGRQP